MKHNKKLYAVISTLVLSVVILFWLTAHIFESFSGVGQYQLLDSDSLLFARFLEQSILRNQIITHDNYGCFPYEMELRFAPLHLRLLYYLVAMIYQLFPDLQFSPLDLIGFLPVIVLWVTALVIIMAMWRLCGNMAMLLFVLVGLLPGYSASMTGRYMQFDYDFLNSFYIWVFLLSCALFIRRESSTWLLAGSLATTCFVATWTGTPLFYFLVTLYGFKLWLFSDIEANSYNNYVSTAMLIGGAVNTVLFLRAGGNDFSMANYSLFQPVCLLAGGIFCRILHVYGNVLNKRIGVTVLALGCFFLLIAFREQILMSTGLLLQKDPIHQSISELKSSVRFRVMATDSRFAEDLLTYYGWVIFLLPVFAFSQPVLGRRNGGRILRDWLTLILLLSIHQTRFIRWLGIGLGVYTGMTFYILWKSLKSHLGHSSKWCLPAVFIPLIVFQNMQGFAVSSAGSGMPRDRIEAINWIIAKTPATSGYTDTKRPEYSILPYWDEGNFLSFYCKRPVAANNAMWGFKTMADVFSAETEAEASSLCSDYGIRYVYITTSREMNNDSYAYWQHMKKMPRSATYNLEYGKVDYASKFDHWFYFWLRDKWAVYSSGNFSAGSNFRLIYASKAQKSIMMPSHLIYEHVNGAVIDLEVDPGSSAELSLAIKVENKTLLYKKVSSADDKGRVIFHIPYSTSYRGGRIITDPFYKLSSFRNGKKQLMKALVDESAIDSGRVLGNSDLEIVVLQSE